MTYGPFGVHDRETGYDKIILLCLNQLFGAPTWYDKLKLLLILSYSLFVILILSFCWVSNLIAYAFHQTRVLFSLPPSIPNLASSISRVTSSSSSFFFYIDIIFQLSFLSCFFTTVLIDIIIHFFFNRSSSWPFFYQQIQFFFNRLFTTFVFLPL